MTRPLTDAPGIPSAGVFGVTDAASGVHQAGRWEVGTQINDVDFETIFENRHVRAFKRRPENYDVMIRSAAARAPYAEAVICGERRVRWGELNDTIEHTAHGLIAAGLRPGDRMAVMLDNRLEFIVAVLACVRAGGIAVPLGTRLGPRDVAYIVDHAQPVIAVTALAWQSRFPENSSLTRMFLVDAQAPANRFDTLGKTASGELPLLQGADPMMLIYTSGTTGKPKGVVLTHVNFVHTCLHYLYALAIDKPQRTLLTIPATHIAGFGPVLSVALASGGTIVLLREFDPVRVMETIQRERIAYSVMVPAMIQLCAQHPDVSNYDLGSWRYCIYGGAIMPPAVISRLATALPQLRMINAYGATETCAVCTIIPHELTATSPTSVGLPLQCDDIRVVDAEGNTLAPGKTGELLIKGPNVFQKYWNDDVATSTAFSDGYWRSGDVGMIDAAGLVYVQDRMKDMINRGGFKVFSAEVEAALMEHPGVLDCALVGVPHPVLGEKSFAFVQPASDQVTPAALKSFLLERIADYKVPDFWQVDQAPIPRNQNGKMQKNELRITALELQQKMKST
jgi:acyl-CoA synthetase (AMP-forming)/AMP-acid ligase II